MRNEFSACHPIVNFAFYIVAFVMGMCFLHPLFVGCSLLMSLTYYGIVKKYILKYALSMLLLFLGFTLINPIFNIYGKTVLFTYFNNRPYTLEGLCYGMALAAMFISVLTWFATYNHVMTEDKFLYCFGKAAPSVSLILTMVFRMVPEFNKKSGQISAARKCIGKATDNGTYYEKVGHGMQTLSALTSWALEGGIVMSDSMKSRGYGCGKRTYYSIYTMTKRDVGLLGVIFILLILIITGVVNGGTKVQFVPYISVSGTDNIWTITGFFSYFLLLSIPTIMSLMEELKWHILKSRI